MMQLSDPRLTWTDRAAILISMLHGPVADAELLVTIKEMLRLMAATADLGDIMAEKEESTLDQSTAQSKCCRCNSATENPPNSDPN